MTKAAILVLPLVLVLCGICQRLPKPSAFESSAPQTQRSNDPAVNPDRSVASANQPAAQEPVAPAATGNSADSEAQRGGDVPANTEMRATLDTPLSSKTSKPGDRFTATIAQPVAGRNGAVILRGARIEGEVSELEQGKAPAMRGKGKLDLRLRDIVLPSGQTIPLNASLVSVHHTNVTNMQKGENERQVDGGAQRNSPRSAGADGEATIGEPAFGGPLKGLAIGTLAGGGYVLATDGRAVNLPAQTGMVIRLDEPLSVSSGSQ